jgi:hypothetical protein
VLQHTMVGDCTVLWQVVGAARRIEIKSLIDHAATTPGCRMAMDGSIVPIPNADVGTIFFGAGDQWPDLALVREWLPKHWELWDAVKVAYWDILLPMDHRRCDGSAAPLGGGHENARPNNRQDTDHDR